jgi:hypothetical protein
LVYNVGVGVGVSFNCQSPNFVHFLRALLGAIAVFVTLSPQTSISTTKMPVSFRFGVLVGLLVLNLQAAIAVPLAEPEALDALEARAPGDTAALAIPVDVPCTGIEDICEADCIAILCHGKSPVM